MKKTYKLYMVTMTNGILQHVYIEQTPAANIVEAEYNLQTKMVQGNEYVITRLG